MFKRTVWRRGGIIMTDKKKPKDYTECDCSKCKDTCIHKDAYRRLPREIGGLGLCKNLKKK